MTLVATKMNNSSELEISLLDSKVHRVVNSTNLKFHEISKFSSPEQFEITLLLVYSFKFKIQCK